MVQESEGFLVTASLKKMRELRVDRSRKFFLQTRNLLRNSLQLRKMSSGITPTGFVCDEGQPFAQGGCELLLRRIHPAFVQICKQKLERNGVFSQACGMAEPEAKRVLIVDDDLAVLRIIRDAFQSILRWEVDTSPKPEYGFELALKKSYDLMIFDFSMPLIDGALLFDLISKVYENTVPPRKVPPLLLVSGQGTDERARELRQQARVCGFLPKPFTLKQLLEKVKEALPGARVMV